MVASVIPLTTTCTVLQPVENPAKSSPVSRQLFAGQRTGIKQVAEHIWLASFVDYDLGYFDDDTCRLEPLDNAFGPKVLPMSPA